MGLLNVKKKFVLTVILTIILFSSCASNFEEEKKNLLKESSKEDLVKSFEVSKIEPGLDAKNFEEKEFTSSVQSSKMDKPLTH